MASFWIVGDTIADQIFQHTGKQSVVTFNQNEHGELADINAELNRASEQLHKKDTARADWISGISHDIRTPLSV